MRALTTEEIDALRETQRKAVAKEVPSHHAVRKGQYIKDETEPSGIREISEEEIAAVTAGFPPVPQSIYLVLAVLKERPTRNLFAGIPEVDAQVGMEIERCDLGLPIATLTQRYFNPSLIPMVQYLRENPAI